MVMAMAVKEGITTMSINSKITRAIAGFFSLLILVLAQPIFAEPYLAFKNNLQCAACHVNPIGGGARTAYGALYGTQMLPQRAGSGTQFDAGNISETFRVGADFRANYYQHESDGGEDAKTFQTQTGQVYFIFQPKDSRFTLYVDEQIAPGTALNRETFIMARLGDHSYVKAGKLMLPYGIRLEDNSAFTRQASGINFQNSDNGVELGLQYTHTFINFAVSNGSSGLTNDDKRMQYLGRVEYLRGNWRVGASALVNDAELGQRSMFNIFGGFNWLGFTFLAEVDHIEDESVSFVPDTYQEQRVGLFEINRELTKGVNLKFTTEYLDPDSNIAENQRTRNSLLLEYTPYSNIQLRAGVRNGEDIPQKVEGNYTDFFAQVHFYY
jgi:hypothetical protein